METFGSIECVVRSAEVGSFAEAARRLSLTPAAVGNPDWHFENRQVDLIAQGFDAVVGGGFELPPGVVARKLTPAHRVLVASAGYLGAHGSTDEPDDLKQHDGILIRSPQTGRVRSWPLTPHPATQPAGVEGANDHE